MIQDRLFAADKDQKRLRVIVACRKFDHVIGGVERMSTTLMNELVARGHDVFLFTWDEKEDAHAFYPMAPQITWVKLAMGNPARKAGFLLRLKRAMKVRSILRNIAPDVVLGFQEGSFVTLKLYSLGLHIPMICAIRESPFRYKYIPAKPPFWFSCQIFRLAAAITVQVARYADAFPNFLRNRMVTIPNHITPVENRAQPANNSSRKIILSTGRLSPEKNHMALIQAFSKIADQYSDWSLVIVGRGGESTKMETYIKSLPLFVGERIQLPGASDDIPSYLRQAHIFCLPSRWEGFPNALAEAMAHGLPSVGFEECDGVRDLIDSGVTGLLAHGHDDVEDLSIQLSTLMNDPILRQKMGDEALQKSLQYQPKAIFDMWESLLSEAAIQ